MRRSAKSKTIREFVMALSCPRSICHSRAFQIFGTGLGYLRSYYHRSFVTALWYRKYWLHLDLYLSLGSPETIGQDCKKFTPIALVYRITQLTLSSPRIILNLLINKSVEQLTRWNVRYLKLNIKSRLHLQSTEKRGLTQTIKKLVQSRFPLKLECRWQLKNVYIGNLVQLRTRIQCKVSLCVQKVLYF